MLALFVVAREAFGRFPAWDADAAFAFEFGAPASTFAVDFEPLPAFAVFRAAFFVAGAGAFVAGWLTAFLLAGLVGSAELLLASLAAFAVGAADLAGFFLVPLAGVTAPDFGALPVSGFLAFLAGVALTGADFEASLRDAAAVLTLFDLPSGASAFLARGFFVVSRGAALVMVSLDAGLWIVRIGTDSDHPV